MLTQARLKELFSYDPDTGTFTRINPTWKRRREEPGKEYCGFSVDNRAYAAHRLAWLYVYGFFPDRHIDHINGDPHDNRIANLRLATRSQNHGNSRRAINNTSGYKGVTKAGNKWQARICRVYLGTFATLNLHTLPIARPRKSFSVNLLGLLKDKTHGTATQSTA